MGKPILWDINTHNFPNNMAGYYFLWESMSFPWFSHRMRKCNKSHLRDESGHALIVNHMLHKKWSFPLRIFSLNVTKFALSCGFDHIYWRNPKWKTSFFVEWSLREKFPNTEFLLVHIFLYLDWIQENTDQKKLRIFSHSGYSSQSITTFFTIQCEHHEFSPGIFLTK